jgi:ribosomal protein S18 acetylase RimI-like enzyme
MNLFMPPGGQDNHLSYFTQMTTTRRATLQDLEELTPLFDAYRQFYKQPGDLANAYQFLKERLSGNESVVFMAFNENNAIGFTQLYPIFSSVSMQKAWLLNDLFVDPTARRSGAAEALLNAAKEHGIHTGAKWLLLETANDNFPAQSLYEKNGWVKAQDIFYTLDL